MVRDGSGGPTPGQEAAAQIGLRRALLAGSEKGITVEDNIAAYGELGFAPHVAGSPATRDLSTTVMGQAISLPVLISPTGVQAVHPDGEVAVARAAAARGTAMGLSSFASKPIEEVVAANPQTFFQIYWVGTRDEILQRVERARAAGAVGLIATLDWSFSHGRDWGSPVIPETLSLQAMARFAPEALAPSRGGCTAFAKIRAAARPHRAEHGAKRVRRGPPFFGAYGAWMQTPPPSWEDVAWMREQWGGAFMLKGRYPDRRRQAGGRRRRDRHLGVQPRRATTSTAPRPPSGPCSRSPRPWAIRSRCSSTGGSGGAATWSRRSRSVRRRS